MVFNRFPGSLPIFDFARNYLPNLLWSGQMFLRLNLLEFSTETSFLDVPASGIINHQTTTTTTADTFGRLIFYFWIFLFCVGSGSFVKCCTVLRSCQNRNEQIKHGTPAHFHS
jgi:hypothetical protein